MKIAVVGLGYVGLPRIAAWPPRGFTPLCLQFGRGGLPALGLDLELGKLESFNRASLVALVKGWGA